MCYIFYILPISNRVSVGVGSWIGNGMLGVVGSSHLCVQ